MACETGRFGLRVKKEPSCTDFSSHLTQFPWLHYWKLREARPNSSDGIGQCEVYMMQAKLENK